MILRTLLTSFLILSVGLLASCFSLHKKSNKICLFEIEKSNGLQKESLGPLKVLVPKGWCFNKPQSKSDKKRFVLEMTPECYSFSETKYFVHFAYFKERKDRPFVEKMQNTKYMKNPVFHSFDVGGFKGKSVRYESSSSNQDVFTVAALRENDAILIMISAPTGKFTKMEKAMKSILHSLSSPLKKSEKIFKK